MFYWGSELQLRHKCLAINRAFAPEELFLGPHTDSLAVPTNREKSNAASAAAEGGLAEATDRCVARFALLDLDVAPRPLARHLCGFSPRREAPLEAPG